MIKLKFALGEGTLQEASLAISKLATHIVSPEEECSIIKGGHAVSLTALDVCYVQRLLIFVKTIVQFAQVFNKSPIVQVRRAIDTKLSFQVVTT